MNNDEFPTTSRILPVHILPVTRGYEDPCRYGRGHSGRCRLSPDMRLGTIRGIASGRIKFKAGKWDEIYERGREEF